MEQIGFASMAKSVPPGSAEHFPKKRAPRQPPTAELPPDAHQQIFGQNLKIARLKRGMTLLELSEAAEMNQSYLSKVENGEKNVTLSTMKKLAAVVGCDVIQMLQQAPLDGEPST